MTIRRKIILWICGVLPLFTVAAAQAQAPSGSYLRSCGQIQMNGQLLTASCATGGNPGALKTTINTAACGSDISNDTGWLSCFSRPGTWGEGHAFPRGSYLESCTRPFVNGASLAATCKNRNAGSTRSELNLASCRMGNNITNIDGRLICIR